MSDKTALPAEFWRSKYFDSCEEIEKLRAENARLRSNHEVLQRFYKELQAERDLLLCDKAENARLRAEVEDLKSAELHTCHSDCTRSGCVARRYREALENIHHMRSELSDGDAEAIAMKMANRAYEALHG
jgi:cell division protein FtsB